MLLLAWWHKTHNGREFVCIITSLADLQTQMHNEIGALIGHFEDWLTLANTEDIHDIPAMKRDKCVYLVDEADSVLNSLLSFSPNDGTLDGCFFLKDVQTYFFSATMSREVLQMVKDVFGPCKLTQWKSQY